MIGNVADHIFFFINIFLHKEKKIVGPDFSLFAFIIINNSIAVSTPLGLQSRSKDRLLRT